MQRVKHLWQHDSGSVLVFVAVTIFALAAMALPVSVAMVVNGSFWPGYSLARTVYFLRLGHLVVILAISSSSLTMRRSRMDDWRLVTWSPGKSFKRPS